MPDVESSWSWPECQASMIRGLEIYSDSQLLGLFQQDPTTARYFIGLFCRHHAAVDQILETTITDSADHPAWRHRLWTSFHYTLLALDLKSIATLTDWFAQQTQAILTGSLDPGAGASLGPWLTGSSDAPQTPIPHHSPVLTCYLMQGLDALAPDLRFILLLRDRFAWTADQIAAQLTQEGYPLSPQEAQIMTQEARQQLFQQLPKDVRVLYLTNHP